MRTTRPPWYTQGVVQVYPTHGGIPRVVLGREGHEAHSTLGYGGRWVCAHSTLGGMVGGRRDTLVYYPPTHGSHTIPVYIAQCTALGTPSNVRLIHYEQAGYTPRCGDGRRGPGL